MKEEKTHNARIKDLLILGHIYPDLDLFNEDLEKIMKPSRDTVNKLDRLARGQTLLGSKKEKDFFKKYEYIFDVIEYFGTTRAFLAIHYDEDGKPKKKSPLPFFQEYMKAHQENTDKILAALEKMDDLGFYEVRLEEGEDFTQDKHQISTAFNYNNMVDFLENITLIPTYNRGRINYRSTGSNYKITITPFAMENKQSCAKNIMVNSLVFDAERLPDSLSKKDIFVPIIKLSENKKEESDAVVNAVELGVAVEDLEAQLDMTSSMIERLDGVQSKPELLALLSSIRQGVTQMGGISDAYDQSIIEQYQGITPKILQKERAAYKSDRSWDE